MDSYQNILVALDLFFEHKPVLDRALDIAQNRPSQISLIYVTFSTDLLRFIWAWYRFRFCER